MKRLKKDKFQSIKEWNEIAEHIEKLGEIEQDWNWTNVDDGLSYAGEKIAEAVMLAKQYLDTLASDIQKAVR